MDTSGHAKWVTLAVVTTTLLNSKHIAWARGFIRSAQYLDTHLCELPYDKSMRKKKLSWFKFCYGYLYMLTKSERAIGISMRAVMQRCCKRYFIEIIKCIIWWYDTRKWFLHAKIILKNFNGKVLGKYHAELLKFNQSRITLLIDHKAFVVIVAWKPIHQSHKVHINKSSPLMSWNWIYMLCNCWT